MRCANCGNLIMTADVLMFNHDGSDVHVSVVSVPMEEYSDPYSPDHEVIMDVNTSWTGYKLAEGERIDSIKCPNCGKFPFGRKEVQVHEFVRIVCFKK